MKSFAHSVTGFLLLISVSPAVNAQSFPKERLNDWEFKFYACKHVIMGAAIVVRLMAMYKISDQEGIEQVQPKLGPDLAKAMIENEAAYQFTSSEATFVSDLTFSVVSGMVAGGYELSDTQLMKEGSALCIHAIDSLAQ